MRGRGLHNRTTQLFSAMLLVIGLAIIVRTLAAGGGPLATGLLLGVLFVLAGAGRLWISRGGG